MLGLFTGLSVALVPAWFAVGARIDHIDDNWVFGLGYATLLLPVCWVLALSHRPTPALLTWAGIWAALVSGFWWYRVWFQPWAPDPSFPQALLNIAPLVFGGTTVLLLLAPTLLRKPE